jgi:drug/metabolite transporter, DME family
MNEKKKSSAALSTALILIAGVFWGSMGIFVRKLGEYGFDSIQIVCLRMTIAAIVFMLLHVILERDCILIKLRDLPLFLGLGLGSILFFTICYFTAISIMPLSTAAILLYTSPIWVMLMSCVFFKERLTVRKLAALVCAFGGCVLVSGFSSGGITAKGLLIGLGSGIGYGLYSILGSVALKKYSSLTVTTFTFIIAAAGAWCVCAPAEMTAMIAGTENIWALLILVLLTGLVTAVIPFSAYTAGLKSVEPSKAAILATVEPMVATILGAIVFAEPITVTSGIGIALIFASVVILNLKSKK